MNICIFNYEHVSEIRGGTERVTSLLATAFEKKGHKIFMISAKPPIDSSTLKENQYVLPEVEVHTNTNIDFVIRILTEKKIDIILNQAVPQEVLTLINATNGSIPTITCIHTNPLIPVKSITDYWDSCKIKYGWKFWILYPLLLLAFTYFRHKAKKKAKRYLSFIYKHSDKVVLLSENYKSIFLDTAKITDTEKLIAIPNPIISTNINININKKEKLILFVGRLEFQKRVDRLLEIWKRVSKKHYDWKLKIIGDGNTREQYEALSKKMKLRNIEFVGATSPEDYYKKASILCITSSHEGLPMVMLEALQYQVIPIAFNSFESLTDVIIDKYNGIVVDAFSIKKYSQALELLIKNDNFLKKIRKNITEFNKTEKFNIEKITQQWEELFIDISQQKNLSI